MKKAKFNAIIKHLRALSSDQAKLNYLNSVIESIDYDNNGYNDELINLRNRLNDNMGKI